MKRDLIETRRREEEAHNIAKDNSCSEPFRRLEMMIENRRVGAFFKIWDELSANLESSG